MSSAIATTIPHGSTARRLDWVHLPPMIRRAVERQLGSPVVEAVSQTAGFTPGFASVLTCADGSRHFVKAASVKAQAPFAEAYREEARKLRTLPPNVPAPRLLWVHDADEWVVLGIEYVAGRAPHRPWTDADLAVCSTAVTRAAEALTPAPGIGLTTFAEEFAELPSYWDRIARDRPDLPGLEEAAALAGRFEQVTAGDTLVHTDVRDDNLIIGEEQVWICDWNWPCLGADWIDSLMLLIGPRGDGLDVEAHLAAHPLLGRVDPEAIDIVLALVLGYFYAMCEQPAPRTSPYLRAAQRWQGDVVYGWLAHRRGW